ncbi:hypothetical protein QQ020_27410 [Fulvivirgaceae bacterium BMA12]|uniref:Uncharacterized protein n=1 Tax=Agaribacillus aureus TaxID=3051825 RepID=A0ABT8LFV2_9BACT|nr:hypothetical protein [Fulvivirgaceae bacterium BMA12]
MSLALVVYYYTFMNAGQCFNIVVMIIVDDLQAKVLISDDP